MTVIDSSRATMDAYLAALMARGAFADYFTDDVVMQIIGTGQEARGKAAVESTIRYLHEQAFDAAPELKSLMADGESAALEADFVGRHTAEFAGIAATGREVRVPYSVHYALRGSQIAALRIYGMGCELIGALSA
jgi:predicted ester cyclase